MNLVVAQDEFYKCDMSRDAVQLERKYYLDLLPIAKRPRFWLDCLSTLSNLWVSMIENTGSRWGSAIA